VYFKNGVSMTIKVKHSKSKLDENIDDAPPEQVRDYISTMLGELSDMANMSGLKNLSSLLQVTLIASAVDIKTQD